LAAVTLGNVEPCGVKAKHEFEYCSLYHAVLAREKFWEISLECDELPAFRDCFPQRPSGENEPMGADSAFIGIFLRGPGEGPTFRIQLGESLAIIKGIERERDLTFPFLRSEGKKNADSGVEYSLCNYLSSFR
jgi:hypothetical protein